jgi:hypothetical protein
MNIFQVLETGWKYARSYAVHSYDTGRWLEGSPILVEKSPYRGIYPCLTTEEGGNCQKSSTLLKKLCHYLKKIKSHSEVVSPDRLFSIIPTISVKICNNLFSIFCMPVGPILFCVGGFWN